MLARSLEGFRAFPTPTSLHASFGSRPSTSSIPPVPLLSLPPSPHGCYVTPRDAHNFIVFMRLLYGSVDTEVGVGGLPLSCRLLHSSIKCVSQLLSQQPLPRSFPEYNRRYCSLRISYSVGCGKWDHRSSISPLAPTLPSQAQFACSIRSFSVTRKARDATNNPSSPLGIRLLHFDPGTN